MIENRTIGSRLFDYSNAIILILLTLACLLPIWYTLMVSFSAREFVAAGEITLYPKGFNLAAYNMILEDSAFFQSVWISVQRVVLASIFTMVVLVLMAYPLSKTNRDLPGRNGIMWTLVFCMLFNGGLIPWYNTIKAYGLFDSVWGLVLCGGVPIFNLILIINFIKNLPEEIEEAAMVDGAGPWRYLYTILVPLIKPVLATVLLFTMVAHWNDFFQGMILSNKADSVPLQTYIQQLTAQLSPDKMIGKTPEELAELSKLNNESLNAAKIFIAMIPIMVVYPFLQRYFVKGITLGSVKG